MAWTPTVWWAWSAWLEPSSEVLASKHASKRARIQVSKRARIQVSKHARTGELNQGELATSSYLGRQRCVKQSEGSRGSRGSRTFTQETPDTPRAPDTQRYTRWHETWGVSGVKFDLGCIVPTVPPDIRAVGVGFHRPRQFLFDNYRAPIVFIMMIDGGNSFGVQVSRRP